MNSFSLKFLSFVLIGLFNTFLDLIIWKFAVILIQKLPSNNSNFASAIKKNIYVYAQVFSFSIGLTSSFILNSTITWKQNGATLYTVIGFFVASIFTWLVCTYYIKILTSAKLIEKNTKTLENLFEISIYKIPYLKKTMHKLTIDYPTIIKISSQLLSLALNFILYNYVIFR